MATIAPLDDRRELTIRSSNGTEVGLYWSKTTNQVTVEVLDQRFGEGFEFEVETDHALDAFNHPYAYAGTRKLTIGSPDLKTCAA